MIKAEMFGDSGEILATTIHESPLVIGSSPAAGLRVRGDDVASEHLHVDVSHAGTILLRQLDDTHETLVGALLLSEAEVPSPVSLRVGSVALRLSRADRASADGSIEPGKRPDRARAWGLYAAAIALLAAQTYAVGYTDSPGEEAGYVVAGVLMLTLLWAGMWAAGNRLFRHPFAFSRHLTITAGFMILGSVLAVAEGALVAAVHVAGLDVLLNWTIWGVWGVAFLGAHMAVTESWRPRRIMVVSAVVYYGLLGIAELVPEDPTAVEQVRLALHPLGYLPTSLYLAAAPSAVRTDAERLMDEVRDSPSPRVVTRPES